MEKPLIEVNKLKFSKWLKEFVGIRNGRIVLVITAVLAAGSIVAFSTSTITLGIILGAIAVIFSLLLYGLFWYESALEYGVNYLATFFIVAFFNDGHLNSPKPYKSC